MTCTKITLALLAAIVLLNIADTPAHALRLTGTANVKDGNTLHIQGIPLKLDGIEAPDVMQQCADEVGQSWQCGQDSARALANFIGQRMLSCEGNEHDRYKRLLVFCTLGGIDVNHWMVDKGWAFAASNHKALYLHLQRKARRHKLGIWRGTAQAPWDWRQDRFEESAALRRGNNCIIKGNIDRRKQRVYHMPWQKLYHQTWISAGKGERWFCNEDEALDAGWQRALK